MSASLASLMYTFMGLPLLAVAALNLAGQKLSRRVCRPLGLFAGLVQIGTVVISQLLLLQFNKPSVSFSQFWDMTISANAGYFTLDTFALVALACVGIAVTAAFSFKWTDEDRYVFGFTNMTLLLMLGLNGVALVTDLFSLYVFLEISGLCAYVLVALDHRGTDGLEGGFKYLIMSAVASAMILAGLAFIFMQCGSLRYVDVAAMFAANEPALPVLNNIAFIFIICGFATKAGLVPFHNWLPDAYQSAPAPVAVLLGGAVTQMCGVYALIRIMGDLLGAAPNSVVNTVLLLLGLLSIMVGSLAALAQTDMKRLLAYSAISQTGYIVLGVTCGNMFGFLGAVLHFFNMSVFNTTLFVNTAAVQDAVGLTDMDRLGGLQKQLPVTGVTSLIAFLSCAGMPPMAGFWSKLLIIIAVWQSGSGMVAGLALFTGVLTAAYFLRLQSKVFFGPARAELAQVRERRGGLTVSAMLLSALTLILGLLVPFLLRLLQGLGLL